MLLSDGYRETRVEYTTDDHTLWCDTRSRKVDLHLFEFVEGGMLCFESGLYPSGILGGNGTIGGIEVRCLTAEAQLQYHQGYEHDENDMHDVLLLCKTFALPIPAEYLSRSI
jgi:lincosamide nucleotidyltransferase A/C/D/E